ncbi:MAG: UbiX family flavin prenyltransferase [Thermodesulfobacteriota bacterium]
MNHRIITGISGASGVIYGIELLRVLSGLGYETHLILTDAAKRNISIETDCTVEQVESLAAKAHDNEDLAAPLASGSFMTMGMVVAPCTIKTLSAIANSYTTNLLVRAADVCLKERRKLVLLVRETPLHKGHLRLMAQAADMGALILPPIPAFYHRPKTIQDIVHQTIGKILDYLGIEHELYRRWGSGP